MAGCSLRSWTVFQIRSAAYHVLQRDTGKSALTIALYVGLLRFYHSWVGCMVQSEVICGFEGNAAFAGMSRRVR